MGADQAAEGLVEEEADRINPDDFWPVVQRQLDLARRERQEPNMERVLRGALREFNVTDEVLLVAVKVANAISADVLRQERLKMEQEHMDNLEAIRPFVDLLKPLVEQDLGPFDKIVSLGIEGPDGSVRVVSL